MIGVQYYVKGRKVKDLEQYFRIRKMFKNFKIEGVYGESEFYTDVYKVAKPYTEEEYMELFGDRQEMVELLEEMKEENKK